jgi:hypothetical protein
MMAEQTQRINNLDEQIKAYRFPRPIFAPESLEDLVARLTNTRLDNIFDQQGSTLEYLAHQINKWLDIAGGQVDILEERMKELENRAGWRNDDRQNQTTISHECHGNNFQNIRSEDCLDSPSETPNSGDDAKDTCPNSPPKIMTIIMGELVQTIEGLPTQVPNEHSSIEKIIWID